LLIAGCASQILLVSLRNTTSRSSPMVVIASGPEMEISSAAYPSALMPRRVVGSYNDLTATWMMRGPASVSAYRSTGTPSIRVRTDTSPHCSIRRRLPCPLPFCVNGRASTNLLSTSSCNAAACSARSAPSSQWVGRVCRKQAGEPAGRHNVTSPPQPEQWKTAGPTDGKSHAATTCPAAFVAKAIVELKAIRSPLLRTGGRECQGRIVKEF